MNFKPHQLYSLVFVGGLLFGAALHYVLFAKTVAYRVNEAYETGYEQGCQFGKDETTRSVIEQFNEYDSFTIYPDRIEWYNKYPVK